MIRVFPRKTKWTPTDELAFFGEPPLYPVPKLPVYVSVTFTWDKVRGAYLAESWQKRRKVVHLGGPAFNDPGGEFVPGRFIKPGVTITSRGCPKNCRWCLVPGREGFLRELEIKPGHIVQDNNLLACSDKHIIEVFDMLYLQGKPAKFAGGLDLDYLKPWHIAFLNFIKLDEIWVSFDTEQAIKNNLPKAKDLLSDFPINKKRAYVLIGRSDTPAMAQTRLETVYEAGFLPFAQFYQPEGKRRPITKEWHFLQWKWSRPAAYRSKNLKPPLKNQKRTIW